MANNQRVNLGSELFSVMSRDNMLKPYSSTFIAHNRRPSIHRQPTQTNSYVHSIDSNLICSITGAVKRKRETCERNERAHKRPVSSATTALKDFVRKTLLSDIAGYPNDYANTTCKIRGIQISPRDMQSLGPGCKLNDNVIDGFTASQVDSAFERGVKVATLPVALSTALITGKLPESTKKTLARNSLWQCKYWLLPLNIFGVHWVLIIVNFTRREIVYLDSLHGELTYKIATKILSLVLVHAVKSNKALRPQDWSFYSPKDMPRQTDNINCGVFVCLWMHAFCFQLPIEFSQIDTEHGRRGICRNIIGDERSIAAVRESIPRDRSALEPMEDVTLVEKFVLQHPEYKFYCVSSPPPGYERTCDYFAALFKQ